MKTKALILTLFLALAFLLSSCGYRNPYIYKGPHKTIYLASWENKTNQLQLNSSLHQNLVRWFQRNDAIKIVKSKDKADLVLGGEISSISLPSLSYTNNSTSEVKVRMHVRYIIKDQKSNEILLQVADQLRTEEYIISSDSSTTSDNEQEALDTIIDELSQDIYMKTLSKLSKQN